MSLFSTWTKINVLICICFSKLREDAAEERIDVSNKPNEHSGQDSSSEEAVDKHGVTSGYDANEHEGGEEILEDAEGQVWIVFNNKLFTVLMFNEKLFTFVLM